MLKIIYKRTIFNLVSFLVRHMMDDDNITEIRLLTTPPRPFSLLSLDDDILELILSYLERESQLNMLYAVTSTLHRIPQYLKSIATTEFPVQCMYNCISSMSSSVFYFLPQECTYELGASMYICADWSVFSDMAPNVLAILYWTESPPHSHVKLCENNIYAAFSESKRAGRGQMRLSAHCAIQYHSDVNYCVPVDICPTNIQICDLQPFSM